MHHNDGVRGRIRCEPALRLVRGMASALAVLMSAGLCWGGHEPGPGEAETSENTPIPAKTLLLWRSGWRDEAGEPVHRGEVAAEPKSPGEGGQEVEPAATLLLWRHRYADSGEAREELSGRNSQGIDGYRHAAPVDGVLDLRMAERGVIQAGMNRPAQEYPPGPFGVDENAPGWFPRARIQLEPPGRERVYRLESEAELQERIRQEVGAPTTRLEFPLELPVAWQPSPPHGGLLKRMLVEPNYVCYDRPMFEQTNSERYGWDLGFIHPFVSAGVFYIDVATAPVRRLVEPCRKFECSAGYCLPGDPVPLELEPLELPIPPLEARPCPGDGGPPR